MNGLNEVIGYLESRDIEPTKEKCIEILNEWIKNLYSHTGKESHEHSLACGIVDNTGISWEEQDEYTLNQIREYKECIAEIEKNELSIEGFNPMGNIKKIIEHTYGLSIYMKLEIDGIEYEVTCFLRDDGKYYRTTADGTSDREKVIAAFEELY